ncbi:MAG TPA: Cof-type HAD-IIB family hydrolase [Candidatus Fimimorpha excrementavium]|nr:Cof-type HAD-IIB family hydrolase [Candidatus Fimimorpha excrementavium]
MKKNRIKIIGLDLDGTVFNDEKEITSRTRKAIAHAIASGIYVLPATGRPKVGLPEAFLSIPGVRYALICNGASIVDLKKNKTIYHRCLPKETVLAIAETCADVEGTFELYIEGNAVMSKEHMKLADRYIPSPYIRDYVRKTRIVVDDLRDYLMYCPDDVEKINMSYESADRKDAVMDLLKDVPGISMACGLATNLEITMEGTDKGTALLEFGRMLGVPRESILACGDSGNDRMMLRKVGVGVAMANAEDDIKLEADYVLPYTNSEDGVAWLIEHILDNGMEI